MSGLYKPADPKDLARHKEAVALLARLKARYLRSRRWYNSAKVFLDVMMSETQAAVAAATIAKRPDLIREATKDMEEYLLQDAQDD